MQPRREASNFVELDFVPIPQSPNCHPGPQAAVFRSLAEGSAFDFGICVYFFFAAGAGARAVFSSVAAFSRSVIAEALNS